jgi:plasmid stabilization system protein ParE
VPYAITISDPAKEDLLDGYAFYEDQEAGAGDYFLACVYRDMDTPAHNAGTHSKPNRKHHRMICSRHPYGISYTCAGDTVQVVAVLDLRRHPRRIRAQLRNR